MNSWWLRGLLVAAVLAVVVVGGAVLWVASARAPQYGVLVEATRERATGARAEGAFEEVRLRSESGHQVACVLRRPGGSTPTGGWPAVLLFGGIGTGRRAAQLVGQPDAIVVLACDYPWPDYSREPFRRAVLRLRAIRAEVLATPQALALAATFLTGLPEVDRSRIAGIGASLGVPFVAAWAAEDPRIAAVVLVYGGGDLGALFEANLRRRIRLGPLRRLVAGAGAQLLAGLDPARTVGRIAPRPVLLIGSREDDRVPTRSVEALVRATREPVTTVWFPGRHMLPSDTTLLRLIGDSTTAWLSRTLSRLSPPAASGDLR